MITRNKKMLTLRLLKTTAVYLSLIFLWFNLIALIHASAPKAELLQGGGGGGLTLPSSGIGCLGVGPNAPAPAGETVWIAWQGQPIGARLILRVAGAEAAHTIKLNGQAVATSPVDSSGAPCEGQEYWLHLPPEAVFQGENSIEITNDALAGDDWTAADIRLEVFGKNVRRLYDDEESGVGIQSFSHIEEVTFTSSFDGSSQKFKAQLPSGGFGACPSISAAPLVIYVHGRSSNMNEPYNSGFNTVFGNSNWLFAAPQLHGSWPGTAQDPIPDPPGKYVYASPEAQHDIIDTVNYMIQNCRVDQKRVYLYGTSMGAQTAVVTAANFPNVFAALYANKGPSDMAEWYNQGAGGAFHREWMERECHISLVPKKPNENPFCYEQRSGINFPGNLQYVPVSMSHSVEDLLVPISHSRNLLAAINSFSPNPPATLFEDTSVVVSPDCSNAHCYEPGLTDVKNFFQQHTLDRNLTVFLPAVLKLRK